MSKWRIPKYCILSEMYIAVGGITYAENDTKAGGITWKLRFHLDQRSGLSGSSGPFHSVDDVGVPGLGFAFSRSAGVSGCGDAVSLSGAGVTSVVDVEAEV